MNEGRFYAEHKKVATSDMKPVTTWTRWDSNP